jgi:hypothetical protein
MKTLSTAPRIHVSRDVTVPQPGEVVDPPPMIRLLRRSRSTMSAAGNGPDTPQFRRTDNEYVLVRIDIAGSIKDVWIGEVLELHGLTTGFKYAM